MKYAISIIICSILLLFLFPKNHIHVPSEDPPVSPTETKQSPFSAVIQYKNITYGIAAYEVDTNETVDLIPNFSQKMGSADVFLSNSCSFLTNGSFYTPENEPVGLFQIGDHILKPFIQNRTVNSVVYRRNKSLYVDYDYLQTPTDWIFQAGPMLYFHGSPLPLKIKNDEPARRMVAIQRSDNRILFTAIVIESQITSGPYLADVPVILKTYSSQKAIPIQNAVNLDGGSASVFHSDSMVYPEFNPVGSFLCVRPR